MATEELTFDRAKKMAAVLRRLPRVKGITADERVMWARFLAATPDERWHLHLTALRSVGCFMRSAKKKYPS